MATARGKATMPLGSSEWIQQEREQLAQFKEQELEDFVFSVRNETEWLNEHMTDIFNNTQLNVTEIFKTPGKLRGKTPRTARMHSPEIRAPLTEIFGSSKRVNSSPIRQEPARQEQKPFPSPSKYAVPFEEEISLKEQCAPVPKHTKQSHDSGYHSGYPGMTEDEMEVDAPDAQPLVPQVIEDHIGIDAEGSKAEGKRMSTDGRTTEGSFHSARENITARDVLMTDAPRREGTVPLDLPGSFPKETSFPPVPLNVVPNVQEPKEHTLEQVIEVEDGSHPAESPDSTVDGSSPPKQLVRKSSLTFAALPAREPLATKKSIGHQARTSNADASRTATFNRSSYMGRFTGGKSLGGSRIADEDQMDVDEDEKVSDREDQEEHAKKLHNKSSTQRLHERINLLGKTQPARPTKSIPSAAAYQPTYPELRDDTVESEDTDVIQASVKESREGPQADEEEDWIMPAAPKAEVETRPTLIKSRSVDVMEYIQGKENISGADFGLDPGESEQTRQQSPLRYQIDARRASPSKAHAKAASTIELAFSAQPQTHGNQKAISVSNPTLPTETTTPTGSPNSKFHLDGHLSASKSKLQSIMKSAKNLFSSSARVSNQAKMETMSPSPMKMRKLAGQGLNEIAEVSGSEHPAYPDLNQDRTAPPESPAKGRRTRSSTEKEQKKREKEEKERHKAEEELKKAREQERQKATKVPDKTNAPVAASTIEPPATGLTLEQTSKPIRQSPRRLQNREDHQTAVNESKTAAGQSVRPQSQASQIAKPREIRRPMKPTKDTAPKSKPQPVSIRIGTMSQRIPLSSTALASGQQDSAAPVSIPAKHVPPAKKPSIASQASTTAPSFKSSVSSNTSKAKAPIIRKVERKPTAQEEAQKRLQQQRETGRAALSEDPKKTAQKQAIDQRKLDLARKEQQDNQRLGNEAARSGNAERTQTQGPHRPGFGASRPLSRQVEMQEFLKPPMGNPAHPKRVIDFDHEDELSRAARPIPGQNYQPNEAKRRKTDDEEILEQPARPAIGPPIRQSNIRKDGFKSSLFGGNYPMAPPPASMHAGPSRPPVAAQQHQQQPQAHTAYPTRPGHPMDMAKFTNGKIPFADAPNPPPQSAYKTPMAATKQHGLAQPTPKTFSPMFQNGENIVLDEIETSEDEEDSDDERDKKKRLPDWTRTPNMNQILLSQEAVDTDAVFGPVAPANLEEWFTKDKSRLHKLRMRTSSANWFGPDRLTEDEVKNDVEARQKMSKDGGWTFGLSKLNE